jgi:hypothetical protein
MAQEVSTNLIIPNAIIRVDDGFVVDVLVTSLNAKQQRTIPLAPTGKSLA